ncbi:hypothetical protein ACFFLM_16210 [Deinococcus oregonensis]|uniref:Uncharacterized protein n=1 Tax=Deinococcus oregonensis TaxID=1805970 RepID=A0ABV6B191_9DEIO
MTGKAVLIGSQVENSNRVDIRRTLNLSRNTLTTLTKIRMP